MADQEIRFTDDEMKRVSEIHESLQTIIVQMGNVRLEQMLLARQQTELDEQERLLMDNHDLVRKQEEELVRGLNEKYGVGILNPTTGVFTPQLIEK